MDLAVEANQLDAVRKDMKAVEELCNSSREFDMFLKSPVIKTDKKQQVIKNIFEGKISALSLSFLTLIVSRQRESYIREIAAAFDEEYKNNKNIFTAVVTSAKGLDATSREKVMELLRSQMKGEVELVEKINPDTIGGFILKIGDRQIDRTVARQLSNMKKELTNKGLN